MNKSKTRKHHYISACYLKYFAIPQKRTGRIYALDKNNKKQYATSPGDTGCERDFNYVDAEGISPNYIEDMIGKVLEPDFPKVVSYVIENHKLPKPKSTFYNILISIISLFVVSNPTMRKVNEDFESDIGNQIADILVSRKEIWDQYTEKTKKEGDEVLMQKIKMQVEAQAKAFVEKQQKKQEAATPAAETKAKKNKKEEQCTAKK